ncbi:GPI anchored CFEM domain protein C [Cytospora mali]|uniref:GPI anchored CFEM domain protein C n=1 Tax=Cytospora mali TaxID=578113 RepID=A0A194VHW1_CYTMA|nr:GPI anchored CFEM domain protein C [Valsa mali]
MHLQASLVFVPCSPDIIQSIGFLVAAELIPQKIINMLYSVFSAAIFAGLAVAQYAGLPSCAQGCANAQFSGGSYGDCGTDAKCICSDPDFIGTISCCVVGACDAADQAKAIQFAQQICQANGVSVATTATCASTAASGSTSASASATGTGGVASASATTTGAASATAGSTGTASSSSASGAGAPRQTAAMGLELLGGLAAVGIALL